MSAPFWRELGLEPTADEAIIRKAYAERLKVTNPEDNAEGFKRLRAAYERAMTEARWRRNRSPDIAEQDDDDFHDEAYEDAIAIEDDLAEIRVAETMQITPEAEEPARLQAPVASEVERDERLDAHREACFHLEESLYRDPQPWSIIAAFEAVIHAPAMERLDVYARTEHWLIGLIFRTRPASDILVEPAISHFDWTDEQHALRNEVTGGDVVALRRVIAEEKAAAGLLARIRDKRHDFHRAYLELKAPPAERGFISRFVSIRHFGVLKRFIQHADAKAPHIYRDLSIDALAWWRKRVEGWAGPLWFFGNAARFVFVIFIAAIAFKFMPLDHTGDNPVSNVSSGVLTTYVQAGDARRSCKSTVDETSITNAGSCTHALSLMPDSLVMRQYEGIIALRAGYQADARGAFQGILNISPQDPVALFALGMIQRKADSADERAEGLDRMRQAVRIDPGVSDYLYHLGVNTPTGIIAAEGEAAGFVARQAPHLNVGPHRVGDLPQSVFDNAYGHFGMREPLEGRVILECLAQISGSLADCRIIEENPRNIGLGELAIRVASAVVMAPAALDGAPVDNVPYRLPISFRVAEESAPPPTNQGSGADQ